MNQNFHVAHVSKIPQLIKEGLLNENTLVFNTALSIEEELKNKFESPLKESWLNKYLLIAS